MPYKCLICITIPSNIYLKSSVASYLMGLGSWMNIHTAVTFMESCGYIEYPHVSYCLSILLDFIKLTRILILVFDLTLRDDLRYLKPQMYLSKLT